MIYSLNTGVVLLDSLEQVGEPIKVATNNENLITELLNALTEYVGTTNTILIVVLLLINLVATLCNIFIPIWLKNKEKQILSFQTKEKKRIQLHESIYSSMWVIRTNYLFYDESEVTIGAQEALRKTITLQSLFLEEKVIEIIKTFLDWCRGEEHDMRECDAIMKKFKQAVF